LNAAQLMTHSLASRLGPEDQRRSIRQISGALGATEDLLEGLLDISRLDAGGLEPRVIRFPLAELFNQLSGEFDLLARERGLSLRCQPTRVHVESDPQLLRRILQNFLSNAVRYTRRGRVVLGVRRRGDRLLAGVWDTGSGIPEASQTVIFEEFRRLDGDSAAPGLGLGLSIAERMARLLDHPLVLESREHHGSLFGVLVPRARAERPNPDPQPEPDRAGTERVLVIDNDRQMLESLDQLLRDWGFCVQTASDPDSALRAWHAGPFDLMILDYHLDDGSTGLALLNELRAKGHRCPTLLISADHAAELRTAAGEAGCLLLHKPIRPLALSSLLRQLARSMP
ncbi:MAG: hybrid sensor histidine kinase/response regulator, partial [Xanthomonadaceae bacterium]|nr:hybrid sensor histidine kinase/response regulator [Xanthomonadaceae bacterium]